MCTWYFQCGFCWLSSVCVLEVIYIYIKNKERNSVLRKVGLQLRYVV